MKRIALSLGSLSLVLMQNGHCETVDSVETYSSTISEVVSEEQNSQDQKQENDDFAFSETSTQELENELLSLQQELESEVSPENLQESNVVAEESLERESSLEDSVVSADTPFIEVNQETQESLALEQTPEQSSEEIAVQEADPVVEQAAPEIALETISTISPEITSEIAVDTAQMPDAENTNSLIAVSEPSDNFTLEIDEEMENEVSADISANTPDVADAPAANIPAAALSVKSPTKTIEISLGQVFSGSPMIYLTLLFLSVVSVVLWLFNYVSLQKYASTNSTRMKNIRNKLMSNHYDEVIALCKEDSSFFSKIMATGVSSRKYGLQFMLESMKSEGKRSTVSFWQRLNLLHDIAIIAPMLGLLGTVLGMFYAFYDLNRSFESISSLFDGLGVSVGTTVAGIFVAILAMVLHSMSKYKLVKSLSFVENEAVTLAHLIDSKNSH